MNTINKIIENGVEVELDFKKKRGIVLLRKVDNHIYISGHGPENQITGEPLYRGRVGEELTLEEGYAAAKECAIIILGALKDTLGNLDRVDQIIKAFGLVNCGKDFTDIDKVFDGFSDTIADVLEERGYHTRTVMGTRNLPNGNIPVEIEVIVKVKD